MSKEMTFTKPGETEAEAPTPEQKPKGPRKRKIMIRTGENGDNSTCEWPDPNHPEGGKWLLIPRNTEVEIDERAINRQKKKHVVARVKNERGEYYEVKQLIYPIDYLD